jgi:1,4-dihydroxy-2-naphthoyl-CoA synthase
MNDLVDENSEWTKQEFYKKAPAALRKLKMELKMHEWSDRAAELINMATEQQMYNFFYFTNDFTF